MKRIIILTVFFLSSCATTDITSFTDPDFVNKKYKSFIVVTPNLNLEYSNLIQTKICSQFQKTGVSCTKGQILFPPTRDLTGEQKSKIIKNNNITAYLLVYYNGGGTDTRQIANLSYGSANVYGSSINAYGTSMPVYSFNRRDSYNLVLIDTGTFKKAWVGGASIHAQGMANITDDVFTSSLSEKVASVLKNAGHI